MDRQKEIKLILANEPLQYGTLADLDTFRKDAFVTINTLLGFIGDGEADDWRTYFIPDTLRCLVTSSHFIEMSAEERLRLIKQWQDIKYILEIIGELFDTRFAHENNAALSEVFKLLLLPASVEL